MRAVADNDDANKIDRKIEVESAELLKLLPTLTARRENEEINKFLISLHNSFKDHNQYARFDELLKKNPEKAKIWKEQWWGDVLIDAAPVLMSGMPPVFAGAQNGVVKFVPWRGVRSFAGLRLVYTQLYPPADTAGGRLWLYFMPGCSDLDVPPACYVGTANMWEVEEAAQRGECPLGEILLWCPLPVLPRMSWRQLEEEELGRRRREEVLLRRRRRTEALDKLKGKDRLPTIIEDGSAPDTADEGSAAARRSFFPNDISIEPILPQNLPGGWKLRHRHQPYGKLVPEVRVQLWTKGEEEEARARGKAWRVARAKATEDEGPQKLYKSFLLNTQLAKKFVDWLELVPGGRRGTRLRAQVQRALHDRTWIWGAEPLIDLSPSFWEERGEQLSLRISKNLIDVFKKQHGQEAFLRLTEEEDEWGRERRWKDWRWEWNAKKRRRRKAAVEVEAEWDRYGTAAARRNAGALDAKMKYEAKKERLYKQGGGHVIPVLLTDERGVHVQLR